MKKCTFLIALIIMTLANPNQAQAQSNSKKILVTYFSYSGNTAEMATQIKNATGGDIFVIQPVKSYPAEYQAVTEQAKREINSGLKPAIIAKVENIDAYDVIFVGSPSWWSTIAPPVATFLSSYDLSGKTIVPFITHEGSRMGRSVSDIKKLCPKSKVLDGLPIRGSAVARSNDEVVKWLRNIEMIK